MSKKNKEEKFPKGFFKDWVIDDFDYNRPASENQNGEVQERDTDIQPPYPEYNE